MVHRYRNSSNVKCIWAYSTWTPKVGNPPYRPDLAYNDFFYGRNFWQGSISKMLTRKCVFGNTRYNSMIGYACTTLVPRLNPLHNYLECSLPPLFWPIVRRMSSTRTPSSSYKGTNEFSSRQWIHEIGFVSLLPCREKSVSLEERRHSLTLITKIYLKNSANNTVEK